MMSFKKSYGSRYARKSRRRKKVEEDSWQDAKSLATESYPNISRDSDRFWSIVQTIYQGMTKSESDVRFLLKAKSSEKEVEVTPPMLWEPPGGTHPKTWRAQIGQGRYLYRVSPPKERAQIQAKEGEVFSPAELRAIKQRLAQKEVAKEGQKKKDKKGLSQKPGKQAASALKRLKTARAGSKESQSAINDAVESAKFYFESGKVEEAAMILRRLISGIPEADFGTDSGAEGSN